MENYIESIQIGLNHIITFHHQCFEGMVGESHYVTKAKLVDFVSGQIVELTYDEVKEHYNRYEGKKGRIKFYYAMRPMSPKALEQEGERSHADAISRVI